MKSLLKLIRGELFKVIKSNTIYIMSILLMTWIYATQEKNVTNAVEWLLGSSLETDSFDIIDGELNELKEMGIDTSELDTFSRSLKDKPQIKMLLLGVEPKILDRFINEPGFNGLNQAFGGYSSFSEIQVMLYNEYFRDLYDDSVMKYDVSSDMLQYFQNSNYNVTFADYITDAAMTQLFESYESLFAQSNKYFVSDGLYYEFENYYEEFNFETATPQEIIVLNTKYDALVNAAINFYDELENFAYLVDASVMGTNYLLMPAKNYISEEYMVLRDALNSISRKAESALNILIADKDTTSDMAAFTLEFNNLINGYDENFSPSEIIIPEKPYMVPAEKINENDNPVFKAFGNLRAGLKEVAEDDNENPQNLFYAYNSEMLRKAYEYLTNEGIFKPTLDSNVSAETQALISYIENFDVAYDNNFILNPSLPYEKIINTGYSTVITEDIYNRYFRPYFDNNEKAKLESLIAQIDGMLSAHSSAEILFFNIPSESIAAAYLMKGFSEEEVIGIKNIFEADQTSKFAEYTAVFTALKTKFKEFSSRISTFDSLVKNTNAITAINANGLDDNQAKKIFGFIFTSRYNLNSYITQAQYLIDNDLLSFNYSAPESLTKGYGTMEFIFILTKIIILIFGIVLAAGTIAGEHTDGTMKLLLIRPHTRSQVLLAKFLTVCILLIGFFLINFVVTLIIGAIGWGLSGASLALSIFNSSKALVLHPLQVMMFQHLFGFLEAVMFSLIALTISTLFKTRSGATAVSMLVYFISFVLDALLSTFAWYKYIVFNNTDLFQYMSSVGPSIADLTLVFSLFIDFAYIIAMGFLCFFTFSKRDAN